MSDGPHRSLPMRRPWKTARRASGNPGLRPGGSERSVSCGVEKRFPGSAAAQVRDILGGSARARFSARTVPPGLRKPGGCAADRRQEIRSSDCAIEANANGLTGDTAYKAALKNALEAHARAGCHQIEEHWQREEPRSTGHIRERLRQARNACAFSDVASELTEPGGGSRDTRCQKRTGVDEGPPL